MPSNEKRRLTAGETWLASGVILTGLALTPLTFLVLFLTVRDLLRPSLGGISWVVPVVTEVGFLGLFLLDLWLEIRRRPLAWLRLVPWALAVASGYLNVVAGHGNLPAMVGHLAVVLVFFGYLLAGKSAVRRLSEDPEALSEAAERRAACRYARDLLRDRRGLWWRFTVPSLLRAQVLGGRIPSDVTASLAGGAGRWEPVVRRWVVDGLTAGAWAEAEETVARRQAEQSARPAETVTAREAERQPVPRKKNARPAESPRERALRLLVENAGLPEAERLTGAEIARRAGVSEATVDRAKKDMPVPLSAARSARG